ncbi:MAG: hypothetical protein IPP55_17050 [Anaerolineales bacterium]|nr:hypothetical protein [Anaerolineales bacterium]
MSLTDESIKVISFDVAQSGEFLIFTSSNENGGIDLWRVSRAGGDAAKLLIAVSIAAPPGDRAGR